MRYEDISHAHIHIGFDHTTTTPPYPSTTLPANHHHTTPPLYHHITVSSAYHHASLPPRTNPTPYPTITLTLIHLTNHSARFSSIAVDLVSANTSPSSMHDQTPYQSQLSSSHHLLHLVTSPSLKLLSDHHFSHTSLASSITSPLLLFLIIQSHIACHLSMRSLTCIITCIISISRNIITTRTLHHRMTIHTSLRRML